MNKLNQINYRQLKKLKINLLNFINNNVKYSTKDQIPIKTLNLASLKRGTGGRSSFNGIVATIFGCTGFVGKYICNKLGKIGTQLIIPYRADHYEVMPLKICGDLGQILFQFYNLRDEQSIRKAIKYSNVVINLIGRDWETNNFKFNDVHIEGARTIAKLCREMNIDRLIHFSSLNVTPIPDTYILKGGSKFLRSKYYGEQAVWDEFPRATIIRPADIYGQEDRFLRYYAHYWRRQIRAMPLWYKGEKTIKQPIYVNDIANGIVNIIKDPNTIGQIYQAVGPKRYLLSDLVDWFYQVMRKDKINWSYYRYDMRYDPTFFLKIKLTEMLQISHPIGNLHMERVERECITDILHNNLPTLEDLCVTLTHMEDQVPWELKPHRAFQYYMEELGEFPDPKPPKPIDV